MGTGTGVGSGVRGPDFYAHMSDEDFAAHAARNNGELSDEMIEFDREIDELGGLDRTKARELREWKVALDG